MSPPLSTLETGFFASYAATGVALGFVLGLGRARRIRAHGAAVGVFLGLFLVTLYFAESVGRLLAFDATAERIHLPLAFLGAFLVLAPIATGVRRYKGKGSLRAHRIAIVSWLVSFVLASVTGFVMFSTGKPR